MRIIKENWPAVSVDKTWLMQYSKEIWPKYLSAKK